MNSLCREKVFGGLNKAFFDLAKVIMMTHGKIIDAEECLSNFTVRFHNGRAVWFMDANVRVGPQTHITINDEGDVFPVDKKEFEAAKLSGKVKSWGEFREQKIRES